MTARGEIFLGDALWTFASLGLDSTLDAEAVLDLLGLGEARIGIPVSSLTSTAPQASASVEALLPPEPARPSTAAPEREGHSVPSRIVVRERAVAGSLAPGQGVEGLPRPAESRPLPFEPLLRRAWTRGVLFAAAAVLVDGEVLDLDLAVHEVAVGKPLARLPRKRRWSTRHGAQLLVDFGPGTAPYRADRRWIEAVVGDVVGHDQVEVLRFAGDPTLAGPGARSSWRPHRTPPPGVPVLVFSDVTTFDRGADLGAWLRFADHVTRAGCRLVLLTPVSVPAALRRRAAVVPLDRGTTMAEVRRTLERP